MRPLIRLFTIIFILILPFSAMAHGYWIEIEGNHKAKEPVTVKLFFGDYPAGLRSSGKALDKVKDIKVLVATPGGEKQAIAMKQLPDYWEGTFVPQTEGTYEITGINDERDVQDWTKHELGITRPIQYLKTLYQVGNTITAKEPALFIDMLISQASKDKYEIKLTRNGSILQSQKILLSSFGGDEIEVTTDANGKAGVTLAKPELYVLSIEWIDNTPGEFRQKKYETVRHRLDYSLYQ